MLRADSDGRFIFGLIASSAIGLVDAYCMLSAKSRIAPVLV